MAQITLNSTGVASSGALALQSNGTTTAVTIDASQNVGIGTASPTYKLEVASAGQTIVQIKAGTTTDDSILGFADSAANLQGRINYNHNGDSMSFFTNGSEKVRIDSSGNVGVGTSSPAVKLQVASSTTNTTFKISNSTTGSAAGDGLDFIVDGTDTYIWQRENGPLLFGTNAAERMRIDSSGNLLVGTTSSSGKITSYTASDWNLGCVRTGTSTNGHIQFVNGNGSVGSITTNASSTSYITSSDYRLKEDISPMTGALAKVALLKPVTYKWKVDGSDGQGFIAHELAEVEAGCVTGEKDAVDADGNPVYQGIDTSFLVATLTAAIQEQQALITQLQADVAALKGASA